VCDPSRPRERHPLGVAVRGLVGRACARELVATPLDQTRAYRFKIVPNLSARTVDVPISVPETCSDL